MKVKEMFPRKYATGQDLNGKAATLTIARLSAEKMRPGPGAPEESKWVLYFENAKKGVILNRTLANQIAEALGSDDTDEWPGLPITLYPEAMNVAGKARIAIRARAPEPAPASPSAGEKQPQVIPTKTNGGTQLTLEQAATATLTPTAPTGDATAFISRDRYYQEADELHHISQQAAERISIILGVVRPQSDYALPLSYLAYFSQAKKLGLDFAAARAILDECLFELDAALEVLAKQHTPPKR